MIFAPVTDPDASERPTRAMLEKALALAYNGTGTSGANLGMWLLAIRNATKKGAGGVVGAFRIASNDCRRAENPLLFRAGFC